MGCGKCVDVCPKGCIRIAGTRMTAAEVAAKINKQAAVLKMNGGGVTFSGGEPFCQPEALYELGSRFRAAGKHLMCYSGWTFEELLKKAEREEYVGKLLGILDILVDGPFDISRRSLTLKFRGSSNQRLIDVPASLSAGSAVVLPD